MRFPIIRVKDKLTGRMHLVGTDSHDLLSLDPNGNIEYYNLQNGESTGQPGSHYTFLGYEDPMGIHIELVDYEELTRIYLEELAAQEERIKINTEIEKQFTLKVEGRDRNHE